MVNQDTTFNLKPLEYLGTITLTQIEDFSTSEYFKGGWNGTTGLWMSATFKRKILKNASGKIKSKAVKLDKFQLTRNLNDKAIIQELNYPKTEYVDIILGYINQLTSAQPKGETGGLLVNGHANIFYTQLMNDLVVVGLGWCGGKWRHYCHVAGNSGPWRKGSQVISLESF